MAPAPRRVRLGVALLTLITLAAPAGAQDRGDDSLLVAGASIRFRTSAADARVTEAVIIARRGDTLDVRVRARAGSAPSVSERSLAWRTLPRLEVRRATATDGSSDGAFTGAVLGASIGMLSAKSPSGSLDVSPLTNPGLLAVAGAVLGGLVGLMLDVSHDNGAWLQIHGP